MAPAHPDVFGLKQYPENFLCVNMNAKSQGLNENIAAMNSAICFDFIPWLIDIFHITGCFLGSLKGRKGK